MCKAEGPLRIAEAHVTRLGILYTQRSDFRAFIHETTQFNVQ